MAHSSMQTPIPGSTQITTVHNDKSFKLFAINSYNVINSDL